MRKRNDAPTNFEIVESIGPLSDQAWAKELNVVRWYGRDAVYDLRTWRDYSSGVKVPLKGFTLSEDEMKALYKLLKQRFEGGEA